jgi:hypothetical protein
MEAYMVRKKTLQGDPERVSSHLESSSSSQARDSVIWARFNAVNNRTPEQAAEALKEIEMEGWSKKRKDNHRRRERKKRDKELGLVVDPAVLKNLRKEKEKLKDEKKRNEELLAVRRREKELEEEKKDKEDKESVASAVKKKGGKLTLAELMASLK